MKQAFKKYVKAKALQGTSIVWHKVCIPTLSAFPSRQAPKEALVQSPVKYLYVLLCTSFLDSTACNFSLSTIKRGTHLCAGVSTLPADPTTSLLFFLNHHKPKSTAAAIDTSCSNSILCSPWPSNEFCQHHLPTKLKTKGKTNNTDRQNLCTKDRDDKTHTQVL